MTLVLAWTFFRHQIERPLSTRLFLASDDPRQESFDDLISQTTDPVDFLNGCWATGKVTHRYMVASFLKASSVANPPWFERAEPLVLAGVTDADMSVRELSLATLDTRRDPRLFQYSRLQLTDSDPLVRWLGLNYLRKTETKKAIPCVVSLLNDSDLRVATAAEVCLMRWTGEDYGVRERLAIAPQEGAHAGVIAPADVETIKQGIERRQQWWELHKNEYAAVPPVPADSKEVMRPPVADFTLNTLDGKSVRLGDFRGKVVLINFWATWCTACLAEIPDLIALQKKLGDRAVILGVALDGVRDEHGHDPGAEHDDDSQAHPAPAEATAKRVARAVQARGINYPILLDEKNAVGGRFNGGELPTTVIIDAEGRLRRRFIGERNFRVFDQMIREVSAAPSPLASNPPLPQK